MLNILLFLHCRILGRLVLIPFLEGRRSPKGTDAQQQAEANHISVLENASKAVGCLIGINEQTNRLCYGRMKQLVSYLAKATPRLSDRCIKNYALLIFLCGISPHFVRSGDISFFIYLYTRAKCL